MDDIFFITQFTWKETQRTREWRVEVSNFSCCSFECLWLWPTCLPFPVGFVCMNSCGQGKSWKLSEFFRLYTRRLYMQFLTSIWVKQAMWIQNKSMTHIGFWVSFFALSIHSINVEGTGFAFHKSNALHPTSEVWFAEWSLPFAGFRGISRVAWRSVKFEFGGAIWGVFFFCRCLSVALWSWSQIPSENAFLHSVLRAIAHRDLYKTWQWHCQKQATEWSAGVNQSMGKGDRPKAFQQHSCSKKSAVNLNLVWKFLGAIFVPFASLSLWNQHTFVAD